MSDLNLNSLGPVDIRDCYMVDKAYWNKIVDTLITKEKANWVAHVLSTNIEVLDEIIDAVGKEKLIKNCLVSYSIDFSVQTDMDAFLMKFSIHELVAGYKTLEKKPIEIAGALMWILEDLDPEFTWAYTKRHHEKFRN